MSVNALGSQSYAQDIYVAAMKARSEKEQAPKKAAAPEVRDTTNISAKNEEKLSDKAQELLKKLREKYGEYDFFVGNTEDEHKKLANSGSKEFSVVITADELEKMAADDDYAAKKENEINASVDMCKRICEKYGYVEAGEENEDSVGIINKISISIGDDGNMKIFAELEKLSDKQKERIEKAKENKAEEKAEEKKADKLDHYKKESPNTIKRTTIEASSEEELMEKLGSIDWKKIAESFSGDKFDFSV